jgi:hypothetical protein
MLFIGIGVYTCWLFPGMAGVLDVIVSDSQQWVLAGKAMKESAEGMDAVLSSQTILHAPFTGLSPDFFQQNVSRIVDDVVSQIHASLEIWPILVEICYFHKDKRGVPAPYREQKSPGQNRERIQKQLGRWGFEFIHHIIISDGR